MHGFKYSPEWQDNQDRFFGFFYFYFSTGSTQYSVQKKIGNRNQDNLKNTRVRKTLPGHVENQIMILQTRSATTSTT